MSEVDYAQALIRIRTLEQMVKDLQQERETLRADNAKCIRERSVATLTVKNQNTILHEKRSQIERLFSEQKELQERVVTANRRCDGLQESHDALIRTHESDIARINELVEIQLGLINEIKQLKFVIGEWADSPSLPTRIKQQIDDIMKKEHKRIRLALYSELPLDTCQCQVVDKLVDSNTVIAMVDELRNALQRLEGK